MGAYTWPDSRRGEASVYRGQLISAGVALHFGVAVRVMSVTREPPQSAGLFSVDVSLVEMIKHDQGFDKLFEFITLHLLMMFQPPPQ